jgi:hypothetical protein
MIAASLFVAIILVTAIGAAFIVGFIIAPAIEDAIEWMKRAHLYKSKDDDTI